ncbi:hypothetical protein ACLOJK_019499 [Asimina triloba]
MAFDNLKPWISTNRPSSRRPGRQHRRQRQINGSPDLEIDEPISMDGSDDNNSGSGTIFPDNDHPSRPLQQQVAPNRVYRSVRTPASRSGGLFFRSGGAISNAQIR